PGTWAGPGAWSGDAALARSDDDLLAGTVAARTAACVAHARPGVPGRPLLPRRVPAPGHARTAGHRGAGDPGLPLRDAQPSARTGRRAHGDAARSALGAQQGSHRAERLLHAPARVDPSGGGPLREHVLEGADQLPRRVRAHEAVVTGPLGAIRALPSALQALGEGLLVEDQHDLDEPGPVVGRELRELLDEGRAGEVLAEQHVVPVGQMLSDHRRGEPSRLEPGAGQVLVPAAQAVLE